MQQHGNNQVHMQIKVLSVLRKEVQGQDLGVRPGGVLRRAAQETTRASYARS